MSPPMSPSVVLNHSPPGSGEDTAINVILSTQSLQLWIHLAPTASVADLKQRIYKSCPGKPLVSGQRVIHKGRVLADEMIVGELFKPTEGAHNVHLAVHPSAWEEPPAPTTSSPDSNVSRPTAFNDSFTSPKATHFTPTTFKPHPTSWLRSPLASVRATSQTHSSSTLPFSPTTSTQIHIPQQFILHHHTNALRILSRQIPQPWLGPGDFRSAKILTRDVLRSNSHGWPPRGIFDADLFADYQRLLKLDLHTFEGGVIYEWTTHNNLPYLTLSQASQDSTPTPIQNRAIDVLTYTFPLLSILSTLPAYTTSSLSPLTPANFGLLHSRDRQRQRIWQTLGEAAVDNQNGNRVPNTPLLQRLQQQGFDPRLLRLDGGGAGAGANPAGGAGVGGGAGGMILPAGYPFHLRLFLRFYRTLIILLSNPSRLLVPIGLIIMRAAFIVYIFGWTPSPALYTWLIGGGQVARNRGDDGSFWFWLVVLWAMWEIRMVVAREAAADLGRRNARAAAANAAAGLPDIPNAANGGVANEANAAAPGTPIPQFEDHPHAGAGPGQAAQQQGQDQGRAGPLERRAPRAEAPLQAQPLPAPQQIDPAHFLINKMFDYLSTYRLGWEHPQLGLDTPTEPATTLASSNTSSTSRRDLVQPVNPRLLHEPSTLERIWAFVMLFAISFVPDIWARRVKLLRVREGVIRTVYGRRDWNEDEDEELIRQAEADEATASSAEPITNNEEAESGTSTQEQQPRRPSAEDIERVRAARRRALTGWRRGYIRRVIEGAGQEADGM